ncbi:AGAMOUS-like 31, MADS AFFECTING FLOWERING 2 [Hibiscus trionum]|uniref:AGAMOUS-like 31, MADS AFFECTING FLOWERING 2 n=1 Tax=Hibiscus trionum TaxID=183268 RepID=A0A9W7HH69_HIBTR|nr:AGAMOUS-like 31, MADS AFFECTING FLOWERING 2 [Hibiscus trionum]
MGRVKVEVKRIQEKKRRQVTFSKRKNGLMKKAGDLAVLCDVDVALIIISSTGLPYQFSTAQSLRQILDRYLLHVEEEAAICNIVNGAKDIGEGGSLLEMVERQLEDQHIELLNITQLIELEKQLYSLLRETRNRKTQVLKETVAAKNKKHQLPRNQLSPLEDRGICATIISYHPESLLAHLRPSSRFERHVEPELPMHDLSRFQYVLT